MLNSVSAGTRKHLTAWNILPPRVYLSACYFHTSENPFATLPAN